ncbi:MAG TPA: hypothetical protein VGB66_08245 [Longimicrobium sp.]|jgi:hypothetical protein
MSEHEKPPAPDAGPPSPRPAPVRSPLVVRPSPPPDRYVPPMPENPTEAEFEAWLRHCTHLRRLMGSGN